MAATKNVPGLCESFDVACEAAEATRVQAVQKATRERDHLQRSIYAEPTKRLLAALEARRERKVEAAREECEAACRKAEDELMKALDA